jgi:hypothetical protein
VTRRTAVPLIIYDDKIKIVALPPQPSLGWLCLNPLARFAILGRRHQAVSSVPGAAVRSRPLKHFKMPYMYAAIWHVIALQSLARAHRSSDTELTVQFCGHGAKLYEKSIVTR